MSPKENIAIIGMAGRFPDAPDVDAFWHNLERGHESLTTFSDDELLSAGIPAAALSMPEFVRKGSIVEGADLFDAGFFGFNPREAEIIDPQHRVLLECAWEAMEDAGYGGGDQQNVGVYAGASMNSYAGVLLSNPKVVENAGFYQFILASDKDFLATRIGYKLNLRGPCLTVQTACSTSLVAVHVACQALLARECDMALAGGVSLHFPQKTGYFFQEGMIFSPDGHCRPFDADGRGIRGGDGVGLVLLKRLDDAIRDGDSIRAVILGTAVNNDGSDKMGYTAPSVDGQVKALSTALSASGADPASITYIEAHGTATPLGDTIEFAGLSRVYGESKAPCAIGAVKSNIGHSDAAAGIAGLIKTVLALQHRKIPPTLHFRKPNPQLQWENSRFYINSETRDWVQEGKPRRAAVSSFGIGGTNAHAVIEEASNRVEPRTLWSESLLVVSAVTASALKAQTSRLASHLESNPDISLADLCYTLQVGRRRFPHRLALIASNHSQISHALLESTATVERSSDPYVAFMFSGQGTQYHGMGRDLYEFQPAFRRSFDLCAELIRNDIGVDLRNIVYGSQPNPEINQTNIAQPALFALEYALAQMWMNFGVHPAGMIGHSLGELVAACLAGVFTLEDAVRVVAFRGQVMQSMPRGSMMSVQLSEEKILPLLSDSLSIAAVNGRALCTVSGREEDIATLRSLLESKSIPCSLLHTSHAFHSSMMEPAMGLFRDFLDKISLHPPKIPFISNLTGDWITPGQATDRDYWATQMREKVQFARGIGKLASSAEAILLEIGPGHALTALAREHRSSGSVAFFSLPHARDSQQAATGILTTIGALWTKGVDIDWQSVHEGEKLHRIPLPTYPFERTRFYVEPGVLAHAEATPSMSTGRLDLDAWFQVPVWKRTIFPGPEPAAHPAGPWLIFADNQGVTDAFIRNITARGETCVRLNAGSVFAFDGEHTYTVEATSAAQYGEVLSELRRKRQVPRSVLFCWSMHSGREAFQHLIRVAQAFGDQGYDQPINLIVVSTGLYKVLGDEEVNPEEGLLLGPCKTIPIEYPNIQCRCVDLSLGDNLEQSVSMLAAEVTLPVPLHGRAYRRGFRWEQSFEAVQLPAAADRIRAGGVYLITGGMGGIGLTLARYFASLGARIALTGRSPVPDREGWQEWLDNHSGDDQMSARIRALKELESLGAEVLPLVADVSDVEQMRLAINAIHAHFGPIEGIVHAAGIAGGGLIQIKSPAASEKVFAPKVAGTEILRSLTSQHPLQFFVLCSSVNAIVGMVGGVDYTAANAYLDAVAGAEAPQSAAVTISINWDAWQEVGMAVNTAIPKELQAARSSSLQEGIRPNEGVEVFRRILAARLPQVAVVTHDILHGLTPGAGKGIDAPEFPAAAAIDTVGSHGHRRRELATPYRAPGTEIERTIAAIWQEVLGESEIGLDDNFFELGGHSLIATSVLARIREAFKINLPLRVIFEAPSIRSLGEHVETLIWNASHPTRLEDSGEREEVEF